MIPILVNTNDVFRVLDQVLGQFETKLDVEDILDQGAAIIMNRTRQRFLEEKTPDGRPWKPSRGGLIRKSGGFTIGPRGQKLRGGGTLFATGDLFRSLGIYRKAPGERVLATDIPYARKHQEGLEGMIPRPFLGFSESDVSVLQRLVEKRIGDLLK